MKTVITTIILISVAFCSQAQFGGGVGSGYATGGTNTNVPLPVYSVELLGHKLNGMHALSWRIVSSSSVLDINLEHSNDQIHWTSIYSERASNLFSNSYENKRTNKTNYYRLKITDRDESNTYSNTIALFEKELPGIKMYPNPSEGIINLKSDGLIKNVEVYSMHGALLKQLNAGNQEIKIDLTELPPGSYIISVDGHAVETVIKE